MSPPSAEQTSSTYYIQGNMQLETGVVDIFYHH